MKELSLTKTLTKSIPKEQTANLDILKGHVPVMAALDIGVTKVIQGKK